MLHQMGNHGPAYYKRYPPAFEKFTQPAKPISWRSAAKQEIDNAYDNAIPVYRLLSCQGDHLLEIKTTADSRPACSMSAIMANLWVKADSGCMDCLYAIAPENQRHVPAIMWFGANNDDVNADALRRISGTVFSRDNLFHTIMGLLGWRVRSTGLTWTSFVFQTVNKPDGGLIKALHIHGSSATTGTTNSVA